MDNQAFLAAEAARAADELGVKDDTPQTTVVEGGEPVQDTPETPVVESTPQTQEPNPQPVETQVVQPPIEEEDEDLYPTFNPQFQQPVQQPEPQQPQVAPQQVPQQVPQQQQTQLPQLDPAQFTDQYGNVDMARFSQAMRARDEALVQTVTSNLSQRFTGDFSQMAQAVTQQAERIATTQIMAAEAEKRAWERTFAKYPQVKENKELRDQIHKMRLGEIAVTGKPVSPQKMADRYFSHIAAAREDGVKQAVQTTRVQATAHLETADNTASDKGLKTKQNWDQAGSTNRQQAEGARRNILKQMLADGILTTK